MAQMLGSRLVASVLDQSSKRHAVVLHLQHLWNNMAILSLVGKILDTEDAKTTNT
jgi:hypothetical protein